MDPYRERDLAAAERAAWLEAEDEEPPPRRGRGAGPLLAVILAIVVLAISAAAGWGLAMLVARVASVPPPAVTISPAPAVTATPPATASPSASVSAPPSAPASATASAIASQAVHVVQPGEYLSQIAQQYDVTTEAIVEANDIENPDLIEAGQRLIIPVAP